MTTIAFANPDDQVSGYYQAGDHGDIGAWIRAKLDQAIYEWKPLRLVFNDETEDYTRAAAAARKYIQKKGYFRIYQYWYDGCNYGGEDYIKGRPIPEAEVPRGGTCWASDFWRFDETAVVPEEMQEEKGYKCAAGAAGAAGAAAVQEQLLSEAAVRAGAAAMARAAAAAAGRGVDGERVEDVAAAVPPPDPDMCMVCMGTHAETLVMPCGHSVACQECSQGLVGTINAHRCIVCRTPIESILVDGE